MLRRILSLVVLVGLTPMAEAQTSLRGDTLYRSTLLRAAPGRLLDLIAALKAKGTGGPGSKGLLLRHAQGDHWDLMILQQVAGYAQALGSNRPVAVAPDGLIAWQEDEFFRGPDLETLPAVREAGLLHVEMFHALADKRAELLKEREMENAYAALIGRPQTAIFVRELGGSWDSFTLGAYRSWKHYAEREDIPKEKTETAAKQAGFVDGDHIGPYLRTLLLDHHDSLLTPVR